MFAELLNLMRNQSYAQVTIACKTYIMYEISQKLDLYVTIGGEGGGRGGGGGVGGVDEMVCYTSS